MIRLDGEASQSEKQKAGDVVRNHFFASKGVVSYEKIKVEPDPDLTFFCNGGDALSAVMGALSLNESGVVNGWGIHQGDVLLVPDTDVHWGDPVNTSSKIGQDLADIGEVLISNEVYQGLCADFKGCRGNFTFEQKDMTASGVGFKAWRVKQKNK